jgi:hypothetical protein
MIHTACPHCGQKLKIEDRLGGEQGICPLCQWGFVIPAAGGTPGKRVVAVPLAAPVALFADAEQGIALIRFACSCGKEIVMSEKFSGRQARCQGCGEVVTIPPMHADVTSDQAAPPA